ncbi:TetR/AcrR family transcriptional regulator [Actinophytocola oryzae]|uniref:TetR family transcriptional regulator n=1 Tax=Actinophytocola oryzae TaxID=502181 RepID=A0A4R7UZX0_9PSEU|nr:TetR family transcriptional regulator [Actinophytocola oryzae]
MRVDALRNRDRIHEVARTLFAERGTEVPMAAVARHAGVVTLYRRFPTKEALVTEVFTDQFATCVSVVDDALADRDPWRGFSTAFLAPRRAAGCVPTSHRPTSRCCSGPSAA